MTDEPNERQGRSVVMEMLDDGKPLSQCLGAMIALVQACGNAAERRVATAADAAIQNLFRPN